MYQNKKVIGFICECNPFHQGHKRLIDEAKKRGDILIAVMSGNFVQRGEPSVYDKYKRTNDLLKNGVNMVIELPVEFVMSSAKYFALAGISILDKLGVVDEVIFGSNINDINKLTEFANINLQISKNILNHNKTTTSKSKKSTMDEYQSNNNQCKKLNNTVFTKRDFKNLNIDELNNISINNLIQLLKKGFSYPKAISEIYGISLSPNDILAVEYISALKLLKSKIKPFCIERKDDLPTATSLRTKIKKNITTNSFTEILNYKILEFLYKKNDLSDIYCVTEDIKNAINNNFNKSISFDEFADLLNTKNRTLANMKRIFFNIIFDITKKEIEKMKYGKNIDYIRILGIRKSALKMLANIKIPYLLSYAPSSCKNCIKNFPNTNLFTEKKQIGSASNSKYQTIITVKNKSILKNIFASDLYYLLSNSERKESTSPILVE